VQIGQQLAQDRGYDGLTEALKQIRTSGASFSAEIVWPDKRVFSAALTPVKEGGCVVVLHDVSRFKEVEKVKDEFIATASHDLRNPITSITGFSQLIKQAGPLNDMQVDFAQRIQHAASTMGQLVENMMSLAKMDMDAESKKETLELSRLIWEIADEFQPQAEAKRQLLSLGETVPDSKVQGDPLQLRQAFRNLIGNAIKYTPEGGTIVLSLEKDEAFLRVHIKDTGYGIPASDLPHIFDRFYRVRNNGHDDIEGNGLGLAIVKSISEKHGGQVRVESEVSKGSCFILSLPLFEPKSLA
jgi:signal transduction histidine kinase